MTKYKKSFSEKNIIKPYPMEVLSMFLGYHSLFTIFKTVRQLTINLIRIQI